MSKKRNSGVSDESDPRADFPMDELAAYLAALPKHAAQASPERTEAIDRVLDASLWVMGEEPGESPASDGEPSTVEPGTNEPGTDEEWAGAAVQIAQLRQDDGSAIVPVFTSETALRSFGGADSPALEMAGAILFASCGANATFVINPGAGGSLTVGASELAGRPRPVLRGIDGRPSSSAATPAMTPPADPNPAPGPAREVKANVAMLLLALRDALEDCPTVKAGFAGNFVAEGRERTVVGLELERESDPDPVVRRVADALEDVGPSDAAVDLILLDRSPGPLTDALRKGEPFYRRG